MKKIFENKKVLIGLIALAVVAVLIILKNFDLKNYLKSLNPQKGDFIKVGKMSNPRSQHHAILLDGGSVLVFGGMTKRRNVEGGSCSADIYDSKSKKFKYIGTMVDCRTEFVTTKLNNGKILVTGGRDGNKSSKNTQFYNPTTNKFEKGPNMNFSRLDHTATLLQDGRVLITGGQEMDLKRKKLPLAWAVMQSEIYDPKINKFNIVSSMNMPRMKHSTILLNDGRVLIVGGFNKGGLLNAEVYDSKINKFEVVGNMKVPNLLPNLYVLKNGNVIITGSFRKEIEEYNPKTNEFKVIAKRNSPFEMPAETKLKDDRIIFIGGCSGVGLSLKCSRSSEIFDPKTMKFIKSGDMNYPRECHKATLLKDGNVLITGSTGTGKTAELYISE